MQMLVRTLLRMPGLTSAEVSRGLKAPPLKVLSTEQEQQAQSLKTILEKFGAICRIENTEVLLKKREQSSKFVAPAKKKKRRHGTVFWLIGFLVLFFLVFATLTDKQKQPIKQTAATDPIKQGFVPVTAAAEFKNSSDFKKELEKNPYNPDTWKAYSEKLEAEGDSAGGLVAKEFYNKAIKNQMILASLAKTFGNNVRVEVTEDAVYYRTSKNFTESEFYDAAAKLRDTLSVKFKGKNLIIENYKTNGKIQRIEMEPNKK